ncbi:MAG: phospholipase [Bacteroidetes bacterium]|nr:MAG: phospholipase [Bacteroidota bacterium]
MSFAKSITDHSGYVAGNSVNLIHGGKQYFELMIALIDNTKETIHLQTYIYEEDSTGRMVALALKRAAARQVKVYLLVDGYASQRLSFRMINDLKEAGIEFRFFNPILRSKFHYVGRRLHHKLLVIDGEQALVGGINISDHYNDLPNHKAWFDFALHVKGPIARELCILCWKTWNGYPLKMGLTPCEESKEDSFVDVPGPCLVRMRRNDWVRRKNQVSRSYLQIFRKAQHEIIIISSYFLPGKRFRNKIRKAIRRGVRIKIIMASLSDLKIAKQAERHMYPWLFKNRIDVFEYKPSILHAKMAICDGQWITLGSYNINNISAFASIELNLDVRNQSFAQKVKAEIDKIIEQDCIQILPEKFKAQYHLFQRLWQDLCYQTIRMLFYLFTFYYRQKE